MITINDYHVLKFFMEDSKISRRLFFITKICYRASSSTRGCIFPSRLGSFSLNQHSKMGENIDDHPTDEAYQKIRNIETRNYGARNTGGTVKQWPNNGTLAENSEYHEISENFFHLSITRQRYLKPLLHSSQIQETTAN